MARAQQAKHLRRERLGSGDILDAGLGRVGDDEAQGRVDGVASKIRGDVNTPDASDRFQLLHSTTLAQTAQTRVVATALRVQRLRHGTQLLAARLDDLDRTIESGGRVHPLNHPIDETAQKDAFAKL